VAVAADGVGTIAAVVANASRVGDSAVNLGGRAVSVAATSVLSGEFAVAAGPPASRGAVASAVREMSRHAAARELIRTAAATTSAA